MPIPVAVVSTMAGIGVMVTATAAMAMMLTVSFVARFPLTMRPLAIVGMPPRTVAVAPMLWLPRVCGLGFGGSIAGLSRPVGGTVLLIHMFSFVRRGCVQGACTAKEFTNLL